MDLLWISMGSFCEMKRWASDSHRSRQVFSCWLDSQKTCFLECGGWIATSFFLSVVAGKPWSFKWLGSPACRWWSCRHEAQGKHSKYAEKKGNMCLTLAMRCSSPPLWQSCCSTNFAGGESVPVKCSSMLLQQWWVVQADRTSTLWPNLEVVVSPSKIATGTWSGLSLVACLRHSQCRWPLWSELRMLRDLCWRKRKIYL